MLAVGDDPAPDGAGVEGRANQAAGAALQRAHRIEEMRGAGRAGVEQGHRLFVGRIRVPQAHDHAAVDQASHLRGCDLFGRHGDQQAADIGRQQHLEVGVGQAPHEPLVVDALAGRREVRALEMQARDAGAGMTRSGQRGARGLHARRHQGRQQSAGAESAMRGGDPAAWPRLSAHRSEARRHRR